MRKQTLEALLGGQFICSIVFPVEYEDLIEHQQDVDLWLSSLGKRLARIGASGAFYMAPDTIGPDEIKRVRKEMQEYRDIYGPAITALGLVRQCDSEDLPFVPGDYISAGSIETAINANPALESHLNSLGGVIRRFVLKNSIRDRVDAVLQHLADDGFLKLADKDRGSYQVTGRIEQLWAVIQFIAENEPIAPAPEDDLGHEDQGLDFTGEGTPEE